MPPEDIQLDRTKDATLVTVSTRITESIATDLIGILAAEAERGSEVPVVLDLTDAYVTDRVVSIVREVRGHQQLSARFGIAFGLERMGETIFKSRGADRFAIAEPTIPEVLDRLRA